jgi:hypothetical protein
MIAGWGQIGEEIRPDTLMIGNVTILSLQQCMTYTARLQGRSAVLPPTFLCTVAEPYLLTAHVSIHIIYTDFNIHLK